MELEIRPSWRDQFGLLLVFGILLITSVVTLLQPIGGVSPNVVAGVFLILTILVGLTILYRHYVWSFTIDGVSIESCYGIISRNIHSIRIRDLRNINVRQGILQRLLGIGDIEFSSAGGAGIEVTFYGVVGPMALKHRIHSLESAPDD